MIWKWWCSTTVRPCDCVPIGLPKISCEPPSHFPENLDSLLHTGGNTVQHINANMHKWRMALDKLTALPVQGVADVTASIQAVTLSGNAQGQKADELKSEVPRLFCFTDASTSSLLELQQVTQVPVCRLKSNHVHILLTWSCIIVPPHGYGLVLCT